MTILIRKVVIVRPIRSIVTPISLPTLIMSHGLEHYLRERELISLFFHSRQYPISIPVNMRSPFLFLPIFLIFHGYNSKIISYKWCFRPFMIFYVTSVPSSSLCLGVHGRVSKIL